MQLILIVFKNGVSANLKKEFLLHHTNPDQPKIKALQNTKIKKIKKIPSASLPID